MKYKEKHSNPSEKKISNRNSPEHTLPFNLKKITRKRVTSKITILIRFKITTKKNRKRKSKKP